MSRSQSRHDILVLLKRGWFLIVLLGLIYYLLHNSQRIVDSLHEVSLLNMLFAVGCLMLGKLSALYLMRSSLQLQKSKLMRWRENFWVYASSDAAKYLPGGIWAIMGRIVHYRNFDMSAPSISKALLLENIGFTIAALFLILPLGLALFIRNGWSILFLVIAVFMLVSFGLLLATRMIKYLNLFKLNYSSVTIITRALVVMLFGWIAMGTSFFLLLPEYNSPHYWLWSVSAYAMAFIAGMAAIFAPAGAGVREGVLVLVGQLSGIAPTTILDAAILNRVIWVVTDICFFSLVLAIRLFRK